MHEYGTFVSTLAKTPTKWFCSISLDPKPYKFLPPAKCLHFTHYAFPIEKLLTLKPPRGISLSRRARSRCTEIAYVARHEQAPPSVVWAVLIVFNMLYLCTILKETPSLGRFLSFSRSYLAVLVLLSTGICIFPNPKALLNASPKATDPLRLTSMG